MEFNDHWPPLAATSAAKGPSKINGKSSLEESQREAINTVNEMFGDTLEQVVIMSVLQNCNWELQPTIEGLITLSETVKGPETSNTNNEKETACGIKEQIDNYDSKSIENSETLLKLGEEPAKAKKVKTERVTKNRMGSFCGNIAKLKNASEGRMVSKDENVSEVDVERKESSSNFLLDRSRGMGNFSKNPFEKQKTELLDEKSKRNESESFCGLKVQYRLSGMESSSDDDDDADVVIEDEASDYEIDLTSAMSVSLFLSQTMQSPPQKTEPNLKMINTPSPPRTPQRTVHDATLIRIRGAVKRGEKVLIILRGLPGSGKTTLARNIVSTILGGNNFLHIFSADDFFIDPRLGLYKFDPMKLSEAHTTNQRKVLTAMKKGRNPILVDNTNTQAWEMRPYAAMAVENGYIVEILEPNTPWARNPKILAQKNTHNIHKIKIEERASKFETIVSGQDLLDMYGLKYTAKNKPPQFTEQPSISQEKQDQENVISRINETKSNWDDHEKRNYVLTSRDIENIKNIDDTYDESKGNASSKNVSESVENTFEDPMTYADEVFIDYLKNLSDSSDEEFEKLDSASKKLEETPSNVVEQPDSQNDLPTNVQTKENDDTASALHQLLGAIGSERKASISVSPNPFEENKENIVENKLKNKETDFQEELQHNDNVLAQSWDPTLIIGKEKLQSNDIPHDSCTISTQKSCVENQTDLDIEENAQEIAEEKNTEKNVDLPSEVNTEDRVDLSENNEMANVDEVDNSLEDNDKLISEQIDEALTEAKDIFVGRETTSTLVETSEIFPKLNDEEIMKKSSTKIVDSCSEASVYEDAENFEEPEKECQNLENQDSEAEQSVSENSIKEILVLNKKENENLLDETNEDEINPFETLEEIQDDENSEKAETESAQEEEEEKASEVKYESLKNEPEEKTSQSTENEKDCNPLHKNINSVSWEVSPFPVDHTKIPTLPMETEKKHVATVDVGTMTMGYEYDADYCEEASKEGHKILWGVNRPINSPTSPLKFEASSKVMFHKSSMTEFDREKDSRNRLDDLIDMFSNYPNDYLKQLYEQDCKHNFEWAVEVLMDSDPPNLSIVDYIKQDERKEEEKPLIDNNLLRLRENKKFERRSHSSSPRNPRTSLSYPEDLSWPSPEAWEHNSASYETLCSVSSDNKVELKEGTTDYVTGASESSCDSFQASCPFPLDSINDFSDDDGEETLELAVGHEFINQLENICGNPGFTLPDELKPILKIKKSMVEELYGLWIKSIDEQINVLHAQLDERMAKDEAMARAVDLEESSKSTEVPNFEEIMNMEMAYAIYQNQSKGKAAWETPDNMASRLTKQMLYQLFPNMPQQTLNEMFKAHGGNFKQTCAVIEANIGEEITTKQMLEQHKNLLKRVSEEKKNKDIEQNENKEKTPLIVVNPDILLNEKMSRLRYNDTIEKAQSMRLEAQREYSLRIENFNKAAEAYRKGRASVAAYHSEMAKLHSERSKAAHNDAAAEFLSVQTYTQSGEDVLDLHNLYVRQALEAVEEFLEIQTKKLNKSNKRTINFTVITGHGERTGSGKIKRAVMQKLTSKNIRFTTENKGCLKVTLIKRNSALE